MSRALEILRLERGDRFRFSGIVLVSLALHATFLAAGAVALERLSRRPAPKPGPIRIMLSAGKGLPGTAGKPGPSPAKHRVVPYLTPPHPLNPVPKKPEARKIAAKKPAPKGKERVIRPAGKGEPLPPPEPEPAPTPPSAPSPSPGAFPLPAGVPGGTGTGGGGRLTGIDSDFPYAWYLELVQTRVSQAWLRPQAADRMSASEITVVYFRIRSDGSITDVRIETPSGVPLFDRSALRAVQSAGRLQPLPRGFADEYVGIHFEFAP